MRLVPAVSDEPATEVELSPSVVRILRGALEAIAARGTRRLSMADIIETSGVSRGTLYRYFSNKDEVLAAVAEFVCVGFETGIREAGAGIDDPIERLKAVMQFYARYTAENSPGHIFEVEPAFHLAFFRSHFGRYTQAVHDALDPTLAYLENLLGGAMNRDGFVEGLIRSQLSLLLVPPSEEWQRFWNQFPETIEKLAGKRRVRKSNRKG